VEDARGLSRLALAVAIARSSIPVPRLDRAATLHHYELCSEMEQTRVLSSGTRACNVRREKQSRNKRGGRLAALFGNQTIFEHLAIKGVAGDAQPRRGLLDVAATEIQGFSDGLFLNVTQRTTSSRVRQCRPTRAALLVGHRAHFCGG